MKINTLMLKKLCALVFTSGALYAENASNPLAIVNNTDLRAQYFDVFGADRKDYWLDGAYMVTPKFKLKYELHYWNTDITGTEEKDFNELRLKGIYFPEEVKGVLGEWKYKLAVGLEWVVSANNEDKGIGTGSDQIGPFAGMAFIKGGTVLLPLVQHFQSYDGLDLSQTAFRLIGIQSLENNYWVKLDTKVLIDWENDNAIPTTVEMQVGTMFSPSFGLYVDGLAGVGTDRPYDWGVGVGVRFSY